VGFIRVNSHLKGAKGLSLRGESILGGGECWGRLVVPWVLLLSEGWGSTKLVVLFYGYKSQLTRFLVCPRSSSNR